MTLLRNGLTVFLIVLASLTATLSCAQLIDGYTVVKEERIEEGMMLYKLTCTEKPLVIHLLKTDLAAGPYALHAEVAHGRIPNLDRERLSAASERLHWQGLDILAGVNADFFSFSTGELAGFHMTDEEMVFARTSSGQNGVSFTSTGDVFMDTVYFKGRMKLADGMEFLIAGVNTNHYNDSTGVLKVFTHAYSGQLTSRPFSSYLIVHPGKKDREHGYTWYTSGGFAEELAGPLPEGSLAILFDGEHYRQTRHLIDDDNELAVKLKLKSRRDPEQSIVEHVSGGVLLLKQGKNVVTDAPPYLGYRGGHHPRTAVGYNRSEHTFYWLVADGRSDQSRGASYYEMAEVFRMLGCDEAVNLDGGGSSTLWVNGKVVNSFSDEAGERPCMNFLLLKRNHSEN
jgi:hypothetical protein